MHVSTESSLPNAFHFAGPNPPPDQSKHFELQPTGGKFSKSQSNMLLHEHRQAEWQTQISTSSSTPNLRARGLDPQTSNQPPKVPSATAKRLPESGINQESVRSLAEFLRTREPPQYNFMSIPDSDSNSSSPLKNSPFAIFGRRKHPKTKRFKRRFMRLPDSAVSAKTSSGAVHIAISIPDLVRRPGSAQTPQSSAVTNGKYIPDNCVVRDIKNLPGPILSNLSRPGKETKDKHPAQEAIQHPIVIPGPESRKGAWSLSGPSSDAQNIGEQTTLNSPEPKHAVKMAPHGQRRYVAVSPTGLLRGDGFKTLSNKAGSLKTMKISAHSNMDASSRSQAVVPPNSHTRLGQLPPRLSSIPPTVPLFPDAALIQFQSQRECDLVVQPTQALPVAIRFPTPPNPMQQLSHTNPVVGRSMDKPSIPKIFGTATAQTAQNYEKTHVELHTIGRTHSPRVSAGSVSLPAPGEPPKRKLPEIPLRHSQDSRRTASSAATSVKSYKSHRTVTSPMVKNGDPYINKTVQNEGIGGQKAEKPKAQQPEDAVLCKNNCPDALAPASSFEKAPSRLDCSRERKRRHIRNTHTLSLSSQVEATALFAEANWLSTSYDAKVHRHPKPTSGEIHTRALYRLDEVAQRLTPTRTGLPTEATSLRQRRQRAPSPLILSPVMVVAWLPPYEGELIDSFPTLPSPRVPARDPRRSKNFQNSQLTPPDSIDSSHKQTISGTGSGSDGGDEADRLQRNMSEEHHAEDDNIEHIEGKVCQRGSWTQLWSTPRPLRYPSRGRSGFRASDHQSSAAGLPPSPSPSSCATSLSSCSRGSHGDDTQNAAKFEEILVGARTDDGRSMSESRRRLESRRRERRMRRNINIQLKELEGRVRRMERENRECRAVREVVQGVVRGLESKI